MSTLTKVNSFVASLANKVFNLSSDSLKIALTNTAHTSTWTKLADLTEVAYTYCSARSITTTSSTQTAGLYSLVLADLTLTGQAGGTVGPFRYAYIYDDTATNKDLIGYYDLGSSITLNPTDTQVFDFDNVNGVITLQ